MELLKLFALFAVMMVVLVALKKPLWLGASVAIILSFFVYRISPPDALKLIGGAVTSRSTVEILAVIYLVNFLQVMMQKKGAIAQAESAMMRLFNNRRSIIIFAPIFMGLLPAPNAVVLSAPIVDTTAGNDLSVGDKTFLTSYLRHIPESALPFYPGVLLALSVTKLPAGMFLLGILPLALLSILFCYLTKVRKVPRDTGLPASKDKGQDLLQMLLALWPIIALTVVVLLGGFSTAVSTAAACAALFIIYRFPMKELWPIIKKAFHPSIMVGMLLIMIFKDIIASIGIINTLSSTFAGLPIPLFLVYALITFIGSMTGLGNAVIAVLFPIAFSTIPGAGIPLLVLLMSFSHCAAQIAPTHICLEIAVNYFKSDFRTIIAKTLPVTLFYCVTATLYYLLLTLIF